MTYDDIKEMRVADLIGKRVEYINDETKRKRLGEIVRITSQGFFIRDMRKAHYNYVMYALVTRILDK